ncbi:MAG: TRAP transporter substrate-binding protein DctP [Acidobacteria bacterium]|nr:TRAP transporter substrate-binding protein DctP [Acidobacteriota bacterium]
MPKSNWSVRKVTLAIVLTTLAVAPAVCQQRVRLATCAPQGTTYHQGLQAMAEHWRQAGVELTIYPNCTMGSEPDMIRRIRTGQIQAALVTDIGLAEVDKSVTALQYMPMMFRDFSEMEYVRNQLRPELERRLLEKGFVMLFWADSGWMNFFSRNAALRPDDFRHMTTFVSASDPAQLNIMKKAGFPARPLEWPDALTALQTGMIDAIPTAPMIALSFQFNTVVKHMVRVDWAPLVGGAVISKSAWEQIREPLRQKLRQAAEDAGRETQKRARAEAEQSVATMKSHGMQIHDLSPELEQEWRKTAEGMYGEIRGAVVPADVFDRVQQLLAAYRAENGRLAQ